MSEELIETKELQEKLGEAIEHAEKHPSLRWIMYLSFSTAVMAVIAAVASLEAGSLSNEAILFKNEAVLNQAKASDNWGLFSSQRNQKGNLFRSSSNV
ncbi:MAG: DUF4337 family protein [Methylococcales bacterium]